MPPQLYLQVCNQGFQAIGPSCQNINECVLGSHTCADNAYCVDKQGFGPGSDQGYNCICNTGYTGDGQAVASTYFPNPTGCQDINECKDHENNCHEDAKCYNQPVGYNCICKTGYEGPSYMNVSTILEDSLRIERFPFGCSLLQSRCLSIPLGLFE